MQDVNPVAFRDTPTAAHDIEDDWSETVPSSTFTLFASPAGDTHINKTVLCTHNSYSGESWEDCVTEGQGQYLITSIQLTIFPK